MRLRISDEGSAGVVGFSVAGAIFMASVGTVLLVSGSPGKDSAAPDEAAHQVEASGLADLLVGSPGIGWGADVDGLTRLGIAADNGSGLDPASLEALRGALLVATDNGKVDYEEALLSLGMDPDGTEGFHLRVYPVGLDEMVVSDDLSVAYIADWTSLASVKVAPPLGSAESIAVKANLQLNATMVAGSAQEREAIRSLGADYTDRVYITAAIPLILVDFAGPLPDLPLFQVLNIPLLEGDVYPDHKAYLEAVLPGRLDQYDVIVVGSGVDHANLVKDSVKDGIRDWVLDGGTVIVLGSADKSTAWLKPLFDVGVSTVNGAPIAPDIAHPLLNQPNDLDWPSYDSHDNGWDIKENGAVGAYDDFSHVVLQDGEDVLAVSKAGGFGEGRVILTSYHIRDVAAAAGQAEANDFLENLVSYADRNSFYLDYGGTIPAERSVALAVRQSWLWDEVYRQVPVRVEVLTWK